MNTLMLSVALAALLVLTAASSWKHFTACAEEGAETGKVPVFKGFAATVPLFLLIFFVVFFSKMQ